MPVHLVTGGEPNGVGALRPRISISKTLYVHKKTCMISLFRGCWSMADDGWRSKECVSKSDGNVAYVSGAEYDNGSWIWGRI